MAGQSTSGISVSSVLQTLKSHAKACLQPCIGTAKQAKTHTLRQLQHNMPNELMGLPRWGLNLSLEALEAILPRLEGLEQLLHDALVFALGQDVDHEGAAWREHGLHRPVLFHRHGQAWRVEAGLQGQSQVKDCCGLHGQGSRSGEIMRSRAVSPHAFVQAPCDHVKARLKWLDSPDGSPSMPEPRTCAGQGEGERFIQCRRHGCACKLYLADPAGQHGALCIIVPGGDGTQRAQDAPHRLLCVAG